MLSRTQHTLRNSSVALLLQLVRIVIGFWSRKVFLEYLGTEILGLNSTATSLLQFLNLAEMGIGTAIAVTLYKPLHDASLSEGCGGESPVKKIREIVALQGWLYKRVAGAVILGSIVLSFFFPVIFSKSPLPVWYAYTTFGVLLYGSMLGYFVNYKSILLSADQKEYTVQLSTKLVRIIGVLCQIFALSHSENPYFWWIGLEFAIATISAIVLSLVVNREYPYLGEKVADVADLRNKYPDVVNKVKQIFAHKFGGFLLSRASPVVIYAFANLSLVALYGNYSLLVANLGMMLVSVFQGIGASIGNLVAENDIARERKVFRELFSFRFYIVGVFCICLWLLTEPFITVWLGPRYLLGKTTLAIVVLTFFLLRNRNIVDSFLDAHGVFYDIWVPYVEGAINIGFSIILGKEFGLNGVLSGVIVSEIALAYTWKPVLLFKRTLHEGLKEYYWLLIKHTAALAITLLACSFIARRLELTCHVSNILTFLIYAGIIITATAIVFAGILSVTERGFRSSLLRIVNIGKRG